MDNVFVGLPEDDVRRASMANPNQLLRDEKLRKILNKFIDALNKTNFVRGIKIIVNSFEISENIKNIDDFGKYRDELEVNSFDLALKVRLPGITRDNLDEFLVDLKQACINKLDLDDDYIIFKEELNKRFQQ